MMRLLTSPYTLWAAVITLLWLAIYLFAKRRKRVHVTMAPLWERLAKERIKRPTSALLRRILTILLGLALIFSGSLWLGGEFFPEDGEAASRAPVDLFIVIDTSPSTVRLRSSGITNRHALIEEIRPALAKLEDVDRAWVLWRSAGIVQVAGPIRGKDQPELDSLVARLHKNLDPDFAAIGHEAYVKRIQEIARSSHALALSSDAEEFGYLDEQDREEHLLLLSDHDERFLGRNDSTPWFAPLDVEETNIHRVAIGAHGFDYRFSGAEILADGRLRLSGFFPAKVSVQYDGIVPLPNTAYALEQNAITLTTMVPEQFKTITIDLDDQGDGIPANNHLVLRGHQAIKRSVGLQAKHRYFFNQAKNRLYKLDLGENSPVVEVTSAETSGHVFFIAENISIKRPAPETEGVLILGQLPEFVGLEPIAIQANARLNLDAALEMPAELVGDADRFPLSVRGLFDLYRYELPPEHWNVLLRDTEGFALVAYSTNYGVPMLWAAQKRLAGSLMDDPAMALLLRRWIKPLLLARPSPDRPVAFARNGDVIESPIQSGEVTATSPYHRRYMSWAWSGKEYAKGFDKTWTPGRYLFRRKGDITGKTEFVDVYWLVDPTEVPNSPVARAVSEAWQLPHYEAGSPLVDRRLAVIFFLAFLALVTVEWAFYRFGITR